ncbi:barH-like 2 homeobox protein [Palaemon carinicauda]|uniref:barH-like 2 homeobox protein n=1 Tax=Palaemon carinicauda TaxID=392227 RepID=UPI0035B62A86
MTVAMASSKTEVQETDFVSQMKTDDISDHFRCQQSPPSEEEEIKDDFKIVIKNNLRQSSESPPMTPHNEEDNGEEEEEGEGEKGGNQESTEIRSRLSPQPTDLSVKRLTQSHKNINNNNSPDYPTKDGVIFGRTNNNHIKMPPLTIKSSFTITNLLRPIPPAPPPLPLPIALPHPPPSATAAVITTLPLTKELRNYINDQPQDLSQARRKENEVMPEVTITPHLSHVSLGETQRPPPHGKRKIEEVDDEVDVEDDLGDEEDCDEEEEDSGISENLLQDETRASNAGFFTPIQFLEVNKLHLEHEKSLEEPYPEASHCEIKTKWKRQTAVGLELLAEGGYGRLLGGYWPYPSPTGVPAPTHPAHLSAVGALSSMAALTSSMDLYYRHAQLAALSRSAAAVSPTPGSPLEGTPTLSPTLTTMGVTTTSSPPTLVTPRVLYPPTPSQAALAHYFKQ